MKELKRKLLSVKNGPTRTTGGNQQLADSRQLRTCGCGIVSSTDMLLYLGRRGEGGGFVLAEGDDIGLRDYNRLLARLRKRYMPLIPHFGINGFNLSLGLNLYFLRYRIPMRAVWRIGTRRLWERVGRMLEEDMPVILSIGPNFPFFWKRRSLPLYEMRDGQYRKTASAIAHYVTVTGMDEKWLRVSSWGTEYYISRQEYETYMRKTSCPLFTNIMDIRRLA